MDGRLFLCYFICMTSCLVAGQSPKYALKGGKVLLLPDIAGHPDGILWKHNGNKVAEFNGQEQEVYHPYENRITLGWASAELDITDLRFEDSGDYELEVDINKGLHRSLYKLQVIDKVPNPTISCEMNDGGSSNISGNLVCSAEPRRPQSLIKFEWTTRGIIQPGPNLQISLGDQHDDEEYSCNVSNPLSSETATFTANDCYPDKSSSVPLIAIGVIALLLLVALAILYCKLRHKACFAKDDLEKRLTPDRGTEGPKETHDEESRPLVHRASTLPSTQRLPQLDQDCTGTQDEQPKEGHVSSIRKKFEPNHHRRTSQRGSENNTDEHKETASPLRSEFPYQNKHAINDKGDADADQQREPTEVPQSDPSDSEEKNDPDPPSVRDDLSEDTESSPQVPISSEQPGSENNTDEHKETASPLRTEFQDLNKHAINDKGGADADQHSEPAREEVPQSKPSDTEKENGPDHADVLDDSSEDTQSGPQVTFSSEKPGYVSSIRKKFEPNHHRRTSQREPEKEENESKEAQSAPAGAETSPADQPHTTESSPNMAPKDTPGEHEGVANSAEKNVSKSDSSGQGERNESDDSSEDKPSVPDQRGSNPFLQDLELNFSQEDRNTSKDNQQEDESKTDSVGKHEETDSDQDMYSDTSKQPPSPTQTKPDNRNTDTCQETPNTEHAHPDEEEEKHKTSTDSNETEG